MKTENVLKKHLLIRLEVGIVVALLMPLFYQFFYISFFVFSWFRCAALFFSTLFIALLLLHFLFLFVSSFVWFACNFSWFTVCFSWSSQFYMILKDEYTNTSHIAAYIYNNQSIEYPHLHVSIYNIAFWKHILTHTHAYILHSNFIQHYRQRWFAFFVFLLLLL